MKYVTKLQPLAWLCAGLMVLPVVASELSGQKIVKTSGDNISPVIELYTSEGCSSCPRADDFLTRLGETMDEKFHAVPLAFHVDYWNRLGWEDPFSQAKFTDRQRWIAELNQQGSIYTPELVVTGVETRGGENIVDLVTQTNTKPAQVSILLEATSSGDNKVQANLIIENTSGANKPGLFVALYENNIVREIKGGENKGRTMHYNYVVRHLSKETTLPEGETSRIFSMKIEPDWNIENLGVAVFVVNNKNGETLQAVSASLAALGDDIGS